MVRTVALLLHGSGSLLQSWARVSLYVEFNMSSPWLCFSSGFSCVLPSVGGLSSQKYPEDVNEGVNVGVCAWCPAQGVPRIGSIHHDEGSTEDE